MNIPQLKVVDSGEIGAQICTKATGDHVCYIERGQRLRIARALVKRLNAYREQREALLEAKEHLACIIADCTMALSGDWDKGDAGFEAMRDHSKAVLDKVRAALKL